MEFPEEWPYFVWNIKDVRRLRRFLNAEFFVRGSRFYLSLEKKFHTRPAEDSLEMLLIESESISRDSRKFTVRVYIKDSHGGNHFVQETRTACNLFPPVKTIWRVKLFDLLEDDELDWKGSLSFVCMFGPESEYQTSREEKVCEPKNDCSCKQNLEKLSHDFGNMLAGGTNGDIILKCEGNALSVHRNILSARSPVFKGMFESNYAPFLSYVDIPDIDSENLGHLLIFMYTGKLLLQCLTIDKAVQIYEAAVKYEVSELVEECVQFIVKNMDKDSACRFLLFAAEKGDEAFVEHVTSFILKHGILESDCWLEFSEGHPELAIRTYFSYLKQYLDRRSRLSPVSHKRHDSVSVILNTY